MNYLIFKSFHKSQIFYRTRSSLCHATADQAAQELCNQTYCVVNMAATESADWFQTGDKVHLNRNIQVKISGS